MPTKQIDPSRAGWGWLRYPLEMFFLPSEAGKITLKLRKDQSKNKVREPCCYNFAIKN